MPKFPVDAPRAKVIKTFELLGHKSSKTTEIYTHVSKREIGEIISPLDKMGEGVS